MRDRFLNFMLLLALLIFAVPVEAAVRPDARGVDGAPSDDSSFCWLWQSGYLFEERSSTHASKLMSGFIEDPRLRTAGPINSLRRAVHTNPGLVREAFTYQIPFWRVESLLPLPLTDDSGLCVPDPLVDLSISPQRVVQGQTMILHLETRVPIECEITYLEHTVPCYHANAHNHYALIGISALVSPGEYPLHISLSSRERRIAFDMDVEFVTGHYGYQFIDPPITLSSLLDQGLMDNEWDYLRPWRDIRTKDRMWTYPLRSPLEPMPSISADYGDRRSYGGMFEGYHSGIDYRASRGTPVVAPAAGRVVLVKRLEARGNAVLIDHGWGLVTGYWHLSTIDVEIGDKIMAGEILGRVGNTGLSTGSHLHWEVWINGVAVDGRQWLDGDGLSLNLPWPTVFGSRDGFVEPAAPEPY